MILEDELGEILHQYKFGTMAGGNWLSLKQATEAICQLIDSEETCPECKGVGQIIQEISNYRTPNSEPCPTCQGTGRIKREK